MENQNNKIEDQIMSQIKTGHLKLRSKYIFVAEKLGLGSALALTVLLAVLFFNLVLFYLKASDNLGYLSFGSWGIFAFLESFPYPLVISLIFLLAIAGYLIKNSNWSYSYPFGRVAIALVVFIMLIGTVLTYTGIAELLEEESHSMRATGVILRPLFRPGIVDRQRGVAGQISEIGDGYIIVQTPNNSKRIITSELSDEILANLTSSSFIMVVGATSNGMFEARALRIVSEQEIKMIKRGVRRRLPPPDQHSNICGRGCLNSIDSSSSCSGQCPISSF